MKGQLDVRTPKEYLAQLSEPRRAELTALDALVRKHAPKLEPVIQAGMLGYGPFHYRYASGREGDAARIAIASNASAISLYALATDARGHVAERYRERLPKAKVGKCCVRFKRLADLDVAVLVELIREAARTPYGDAEQPKKAERSPAAPKRRVSAPRRRSRGSPS